LPKILLSAALTAELKPVADSVSFRFKDRLHLCWLKTGKGSAAVCRTLPPLLASTSWAWHINFGTAGALTDSPVIGEILVPPVIRSATGTWLTTPLPSKSWPFDFHSGELFTAREPVISARERVRIAASYPVVAVDMEAAAAAVLTQPAGIPFWCLKVISDTASEDTAVTFRRNLDNSVMRLKMVLPLLIESLIPTLKEPCHG